MSRSRRGGPAEWGVAALILLVYLIGQLIELPGLAEGVRIDAGHISTWTLAAFPWQQLSVLSIALAPLVLVRAVISVALPPGAVMVQERAYMLAGFAVYLLFCGTISLALVWELERIQTGTGAPLVTDPGFAFRARAAVALLAGSGLVWAMASLITRTGAGSGPLLLFGFTVFVSSCTALFQLMASVSVIGQTVSPALVWRTVEFVAPVAILMVALWRWQPFDWPSYVVRNATLQSPLDVLFLPWIAVELLSGPIAMFLLHVGFPPPWLIAVRGLIAVAVAAALTFWLRSNAEKEGPLAFAWSALVWAIAPIPAMMAVSWVLYVPGPFEGARDFDVFVKRRAGSGDGDSDVLGRRLEQIHVSADLEDRGGGRLRLRLYAVGSAQEVMDAVLPRRAAAIHVAGDQSGLLDPGALAAADLTLFRGQPKGQIGELRRFLARIESLRFGDRVALECAGSPDAPNTVCSAMVIEEPPVVSQHDIARAEVAFTPEHRAFVQLVLTPEGAEEFCWVTSHHVGNKLAITLDGAVVSAPIVREAICGGTATIEMGWERHADQALRDASALAAALNSGPLSGEWEVESIWPLR